MMRPTPRTTQDLILPRATLEEHAMEPVDGFQADFDHGTFMGAESENNTDGFQLRRRELISRESCCIERQGQSLGETQCAPFTDMKNGPHVPST
jgi:hypothetical protein